MLIRQTPTNKEKYIAVNSNVARILQLNGFNPKYMDNEAIYFCKSKEILEFIGRGDLSCLKQ